MRAPKTESTGSSGQSAVKAEFEYMGWGAGSMPEHDNGTDLYLTARDDQRFELGVMMACQVKTGDSYFSSPLKDGGEVKGWWFTENREHFEYWLNHSIPHIIVLRDQEKRKSYWVHVTDDNVKNRGLKWPKVLVPANQVVEESQNDALREVACSQLPKPSWTNSILSASSKISVEDRLRYALIVPRLIAPNLNVESVRHNALTSGISGAQALALSMLGNLERTERLQYLPDYSLKRSILSASDTKEFGWIAAKVVDSYIKNQDFGNLKTLQDKAGTPEERIVATMITTVGLFELGDAEKVASVIRQELGLIGEGYTETDSYQSEKNIRPVDVAWLQAQLARALLEIGEYESAFICALRAKQVGYEFPSDPTALAIAGTSSVTAFQSAPWSEHNNYDYDVTLKAYDNEAIWWRSEIFSLGLSVYLENQFIDRMKSVVSGHASDGYVDENSGKYLRSAALICSFSGDQNGWREVNKQTAYALFATAESVVDAKLALEVLESAQRAGDVKNAKLFADYLLSSGISKNPEFLNSVYSKVDLAKSTRTTAHFDLNFLIKFGGSLNVGDANLLCEFILRELRTPQRFSCLLERYAEIRNELNNSYTVEHLLSLLQSIYVHLDDEHVLSLVNCLRDIVSEMNIDDPVLYVCYQVRKLVEIIPSDAWVCDDREIIISEIDKKIRFWEKLLDDSDL
jgi:hypothetical protein